MEKSMGRENRTLISELTQGKELAKQLSHHLSPSSSLEARQFLLDKILSSYEKSLSLLNWGAWVADQPKPTVGIVDSTHSFAISSPRSEVSDQDCKEECGRDVYKKRKTQSRWTEQVKVCSGTGLEGPLDDGFSWRKYGQKDILGANFPRGYYRCTHRHSQGCLATKQVQRSDEDRSIFEVTYRGRHTCNQASPSPVASPSPKNDFSKQSKYHCSSSSSSSRIKTNQSRQRIYLLTLDRTVFRLKTKSWAPRTTFSHPFPSHVHHLGMEMRKTTFSPSP
ncbi:hypothetical protein OIU76_005700 [Salix suchowensis]|nr:hypothetical protein OIU76_005700 [Salix suchowensis]